MSGAGHTVEADDIAMVDAAVATLNPDAFQPAVQKAAAEIYELILDGVQDYLVDNAQFNIKSRLHSLRTDLASERAAKAELLEALVNLAGEFGCSLDQLERNGPDFTHKDGTEVIHASTLSDRAPQIASARAAIHRARTGEVS